GIGLRLRAAGGGQRCSDGNRSKELAHLSPPAATEAARDYANGSDPRETKKEIGPLRERVCRRHQRCVCSAAETSAHPAGRCLTGYATSMAGGRGMTACAATLQKPMPRPQSLARRRFDRRRTVIAPRV